MGAARSAFSAPILPLAVSSPDQITGRGAAFSLPERLTTTRLLFAPARSAKKNKKSSHLTAAAFFAIIMSDAGTSDVIAYTTRLLYHIEKKLSSACIIKMMEVFYMSNSISKARYWCGILYPENMVDGWQDLIGDILQLPGCFCVHDKDLDLDGDDRKTHVHIMIAFPNTTTKKHALSVFGTLSAPGLFAVSTCEAVISVRQMYAYLIHDTPGCIKKNKHRYSEVDRVLFNNFDIGIYEQLSESDRLDILRNLMDFVRENQVCYFIDLYDYVCSLPDTSVFHVFSSYSAVLDRLCRSNYVRYRDSSCE